MKSASMVIVPLDLDLLDKELKLLKDYVASRTSPTGVRLYMFEKIYARTGSILGGVLLLEPMEDGKFYVKIWTLGGYQGGLDYGSNKKFITDMLAWIKSLGAEIASGPEYTTW